MARRRKKKDRPFREFVTTVRRKDMRVALFEDNRLAELFIEKPGVRRIVGNVYKGRVESIVRGIQAAFVDVGLEKNGFLHVSDIASADSTLDPVVEDVEVDRSGRGRTARVSIEDQLKQGQDLMVQITKEPLSTKGVRLTNYVTLPGRFLVLMPTVSQIGVSRRIEDPKERERLRRLIRQLRPRGVGVIVRTAAAGKGKAELQADLRYLGDMWRKLKRNVKNVQPPAIIHEDLDQLMRIVRDRFNDDIDRFTIDSRIEYDRVTEFLENYAPQLKARVKLYRGRTPLFDKYNVETEIDKALRKRVWLKCGGYIIIESTEALTAVDVNTGKFVGKTGDIEQTVFRTNMEAAEEIARQVRLRDLGGIIVLDFIDMEVRENQVKVVTALDNAMKIDQTKYTISEVSELGLVQMTRKRVRDDLLATLSQPCPYCGGIGFTKSVATMVYEVQRRLERLFSQSREQNVTVQMHPAVFEQFAVDDHDIIEELEQTFRRTIGIESHDEFHHEDIRFVSKRTGKEIVLKT
jgi:ribonuclease G